MGPGDSIRCFLESFSQGFFRATGTNQECAFTRASKPAARTVPLLLRRALAELVRARSVRLTYIELHARSAFSFLEGASLPEELSSRCAEHGMPALALLDRDGVYGAPRLHLAAK